MISEKERLERAEAVRNALASQRMEGVEPDAFVMQDAEKWTRGEITIDQAVDACKARIRANA